MSFFVKLPTERYNASAFDAFGVEPDFNLGTAKAMAWVSQLAYETDEPNKIANILKLWGMQLLDKGIVVEEVATALPTVSTRCFVATGRGATIIAFAGTDPVVLANWITDFDAHLTQTGTAEGYTAATSVVWPKLRQLIAAATAKADRIFVTGHSLGGALAALSAHRIITESIGGVQAVYTFGMPRAGNAAFAMAYNSVLGARTYRLVHADDIVPTVAPSSLGFRHVGRYLHCEREGKFKSGDLKSDTASDDPAFIGGVSKEFATFLHRPVSSLLSFGARLKLALALATDQGPPGFRTDPGGIAIELLPARLRDHMPDRYIGGLSE